MSQLQNLCNSLGIRISCKYGHKAPPPGFPRGASSWRCTLRYKNRSLSTDFYMGPALHHEPAAADVVSSLITDGNVGEMSFSEYLSEFGIDEGDVGSEERKHTKAVYKKCVAMAPKIRKFLGADFDRVARAEH